jgi:hypothetical protein
VYVHFMLASNGRLLPTLKAVALVFYHRLAKRATLHLRPPRDMNTSPSRHVFGRREDAVCALITRLEADIITDSKLFARCCLTVPPCLQELSEARQRLNQHLIRAQAICAVHGRDLEITGRERYIHRLFDAVDKAHEALDEATAYLDSL